MAKARKVTITLADATAGTGHRFGVCSLASTSAAAWGGGSQLLSAGRDGTICAWKYSEDAAVAPELSFVLEDHTDWVNDLVLVHEGGQAAALVSCSSDTTLKVWRPSGDAGQPAKVHTMRRHTDYVKALAYAPQAPLLASASCDRTVLLWDLHTLQPCGAAVLRGIPTHTVTRSTAWRQIRTPRCSPRAPSTATCACGTRARLRATSHSAGTPTRCVRGRGWGRVRGTVRGS